MRPCGYCENASFSPLVSGVTDRLGEVKGEFSFVSCEMCKSAWIDPLPDPGELASFYPSIYGLGKEVEGKSVLKSLMSSLELALWFGPVYSRNSRILASRCARKGDLLEVGCGSGYQAASFKKHGFDVTGVDFAEGTADWMMQRHGIKAFSCDISSIPEVLSGREFDAVSASHVIEHMLDPFAFLQTILERLRPGGEVFLAAPLADSFQASLFGRQWGAFREAPRHVNLPSRRGLALLFERAGMESVVSKPDHVYYIAGSAFASLSSTLSMTSSYGSASAFVAAVKRFIGAGLAACYLPAALCEVFGNYSMGLIVGRRR